MPKSRRMTPEDQATYERLNFPADEDAALAEIYERAAAERALRPYLQQGGTDEERGPRGEGHLRHYCEVHCCGSKRSIVYRSL